MSQGTCLSAHSLELINEPGVGFRGETVWRKKLPNSEVQEALPPEWAQRGSRDLRRGQGRGLSGRLVPNSLHILPRGFWRVALGASTF